MYIYIFASPVNFLFWTFKTIKVKKTINARTKTRTVLFWNLHKILNKVSIKHIFNFQALNIFTAAQSLKNQYFSMYIYIYIFHHLSTDK